MAISKGSQFTIDNIVTIGAGLSQVIGPLLGNYTIVDIGTNHLVGAQVNINAGTLNSSGVFVPGTVIVNAQVPAGNPAVGAPQSRVTRASNTLTAGQYLRISAGGGTNSILRYTINCVTTPGTIAGAGYATETTPA